MTLPLAPTSWQQRNAQERQEQAQQAIRELASELAKPAPSHLALTLIASTLQRVHDQARDAEECEEAAGLRLLWMGASAVAGCLAWAEECERQNIPWSFPRHALTWFQVLAMRLARRAL